MAVNGKIEDMIEKISREHVTGRPHFYLFHLEI